MKVSVKPDRFYTFVRFLFGKNRMRSIERSGRAFGFAGIEESFDGRVELLWCRCDFFSVRHLQNGEKNEKISKSCDIQLR